MGFGLFEGEEVEEYNGTCLVEHICNAQHFLHENDTISVSDVHILEVKLFSKTAHNVPWCILHDMNIPDNYFNMKFASVSCLTFLT